MERNDEAIANMATEFHVCRNAVRSAQIVLDVVEDILPDQAITPSDRRRLIQQIAEHLDGQAYT